MTAEDLAELATGAGGPRVIGLLRDGQVGKQLLLFVEITRMASAPGDALASQVRAWFAVLADADRRDPHTARQVLAAPNVGVWAAQCLAGLRSGRSAAQSAVPYLGAVAAAVAVRTGMAARIAVPVIDGRVALPTLGALSVPPGAAAAFLDSTAGEWLLAVDGVAVPLRRTPDGTLAAPGGGAPDGFTWHPASRLRATSAGHVLDVLLDDLDPFRDRHGLGAVGPLDRSQALRWQAMLDAGWSTLTGVAPGYAPAIAAGLTCVVPLRGEPDGHGTSATAEHGFGGLSIGPAGADAFAVGLLHEFQHSKLNGLLHLVDLFDDDGQRHYSPWRDDPRPLAGLLHGAYAFLAVADYRRLQAAGGGPRAGAVPVALAGFEFARCRESVRRTVRALRRSGRLRPAGLRFTAGMLDRLAGWEAPRLPADLRRRAHDMVTEHRVLWRLRNVRPDGTSVASLAADWTARRPAAVPRVAVTTVVGDRAALPGRSGRLRLLHQRLAGAAEPADVAPGDLAYVRGDRSGAAARYLTAIEDSPGDLTAWAGWLVTRPARGPVAPELLWAVHRRVLDSGGRPAPPEELARWLSTVEVPAPRW
ncbi:HEXXH motif domain-containing protein [Dactylosporangium sp. NPDC049525]|uniref:HEXXH motif domain-containing protein n=1 Tax=Dactylosporangium sp. NPDC049525 TaxID=3154730 RepID=UPI003425C8E1